MRVVGLFGVFDHDIPLNLESRITVVHGSNGVGKTIVLRMIHELLTGALDVLLRVPYEEFELQFQSGDSIKLRPSPAGSENGKASIKCEVVLDSQIHNPEMMSEPDPAVIAQVSEFCGPWKYKGKGKWKDPRDNEVATFDELCERYRIPEPLQTMLNVPRDPILDRASKKCRVRLIGTDRLLTDVRERTPERMREMHRSQRQVPTFKQRTIGVYSEDLIKRFREALSQYGALTEVMDRSLVRRLIRGGQQEKKTPEQLLELFKILDEKRRRLTSLGLLNVAEEVLGKAATDDEVISLVSKSTDVFSLYVHDMQKKLALFDRLQEKLEILRGRTDQRFQFKKLTMDPGEGFVFESDGGAKLRAADLSSGEQHEMILMYELLFMVQEGDLVLIDEPEISLHVEWQMELLSDLRAVLRASSIDILMATHSPSIVMSAKKSDLVSLGAQKA